MQAIASASIDDLQLINWDEATRSVGGDEPDDAFLADLIICFYTESLPRIKRLLEACLQFRNGSLTMKGTQMPILQFIKEQAHAIKGSAANIRLWRIAKAAENVELPCKHLLQSSPTVSQQRELLCEACVHPCVHISRLVNEYRDFVQWIVNHLRSSIDPSIDLDSELSEEAKQNLAIISEDQFDQTLSPYSQFFEDASDLVSSLLHDGNVPVKESIMKSDDPPLPSVDVPSPDVTSTGSQLPAVSHRSVPGVIQSTNKVYPTIQTGSSLNVKLPDPSPPREDRRPTVEVYSPGTAESPVPNRNHVENQCCIVS